MSRDRPLAHQPWWCSGCGLWCGWKLDACKQGHSRPAGALRHDETNDPGRYHLRADEPRERLRRAWYRVLGRLGRRP